VRIRGFLRHDHGNLSRLSLTGLDAHQGYPAIEVELR